MVRNQPSARTPARVVGREQEESRTRRGWTIGPRAWGTLCVSLVGLVGRELWAITDAGTVGSKNITDRQNQKRKEASGTRYSPLFVPHNQGHTDPDFDPPTKLIPT